MYWALFNGFSHFITRNYISTVRDANLTIDRNARTHLNVRITNVFSLRVLDKRKKKVKKKGNKPNEMSQLWLTKTQTFNYKSDWSLSSSG